MAYLGNDLQVAFPVYRNIDDISGSFNSSLKTFPLTVSGVAPVPAPLYSQQCLISVGGVVQRPDDTGLEGFRLSGGNIIFASAPTTGADFFGVILAGADYINAGGNFPSGTAAVPSITFNDDLDTGIYNSGINQVSITTGGSERLRIDSAGQIEAVSLGTAAAPAFSFTTDPNTGIYSPGADQVAISTNGTGRLFVDASGNVGVKTTTTTYDAAKVGSSHTFLSIQSGASSYSNINIAGNTSSASRLGILAFVNDANSASYKYNSWIEALSTGTTAGQLGGALLFSTSGEGSAAGPVERLRIDSSGNVGINGTINGTAKLQVSGALRLFGSGDGTETTNACLYQASGGGLGIGVNGGEKLRITSAGLVGVGTSSPGYLIHLNTASAIDVESAVQNSAGLSRYGTRGSGNAFAGSFTAGKAFELWSAGSQAVTIDSSQRVGVGTTSPAYPLDLGTSNDGRARQWFATTSFIGDQGDGTGFQVRALGAGTSGIKFANYANNVEYARFDSSGRLGIGTSTPSQTLDCAGNIRSYANAAEGSLILGSNNNAYIASNSAELRVWTRDTRPVAFLVNDTERARIDSSGRLLVGTSTSRGNNFNLTGQNMRLQVEGTDYLQSGASFTSNSNTAGEGPHIAINRSRGTTVGSNTVVQDGDRLGLIAFQGNDGAEFVIGAAIDCLVDGTPGANDMPGRLVFSTTADGASSPTERMRIRSDGKIQIGGTGITDARLNVVTSASERLGQFISQNTGGDAATFGLYVGKYSNDSTTTQRFIGFSINNDGSGCGQINANGSGQAAFGTFSDQRLKENIQDLPSQLGLIKALRPVEFDFKDGNGHQLGFIAQEMQQVYPDVVSEQDGYLTITGFGKTECRLIKALQEAVAKIEALEAKVAALESA